MMMTPVRLPPGNSRRASRLDVVMEAGLREFGTTKFPVRVVDLSTSGFRCETSFTLRTGASVWLTIPSLAAIEAVVAWKRGFTYGCQFDRPLHPAVFDHIARQHGIRNARRA